MPQDRHGNEVIRVTAMRTRKCTMGGTEKICRPGALSAPEASAAKVCTVRRRSLTRPPLSPTQRLRRPCSRMRAAVGEHGAPNALRASAARAHARAANLPTAQHSSAKRNPATGRDYRWSRGKLRGARSRGKLQGARPPSLGRGSKKPITGVNRQPQGKTHRGKSCARRCLKSGHS